MLKMKFSFRVSTWEMGTFVLFQFTNRFREIDTLMLMYDQVIGTVPCT